MIKHYVQNLSSRDRQALLILAIGLVLYMLVSLRVSLATSLDRSEQRNERLMTQLIEMELMAAKFNSSKSSYRRTGSLASQLNRIGSSIGLSYSSLQPTSAGARVTLNGIAQSEMMKWLEAMGAQGYQVTNLTIAPSANAKISLSAVVVDS